MRHNYTAYFLTGLLIVFICFYGYEKSARKDAENLNFDLILSAEKKLADEKLGNEIKIQALEKHNDSLQSAFLVSENKRKANYKLYENALKNTPTNYTARQRYSDSLSATLR